MRRISNGDSENVAAAFCYISSVFLSVAAVWGLGGGLLGKQMDNARAETEAAKDKPSCSSRETISPLADLPPGLVVAPTDVGVSILRFTESRILSAPYHRNQGGMLTEMHIGLAPPRDAEAFLRGTGVSILAFCADNPQTRQIAKIKPDGLYAQLEKGNVPAYLQALPTPAGSPIRLFRYVPTGL
jgi:hypothetical protein